MRIDSHQHYLDFDRNHYDWATDDLPDILHRAYGPDDLRPHLHQHRIDRTVLVQAADDVAETDWLLDIAGREPSVAGVVGWLDMEADDFAQMLDRYRRNPKFVSIRPMLQYLDDDRYILRPKVIDSLKRLANADVAFDFLTFAKHLPYVNEALQQAPNLRAVIDHISKPAIKDHVMDPWRDDIAQTASYDNVYCKLSGMITEADHSAWTVDDLRPYVEHVVDCFGFDRVMFGSDWPVCRLAGEYDQVIGAVETILEPQLDDQRRAAVFGDNATRFYKLQLPQSDT